MPNIIQKIDELPVTGTGQFVVSEHFNIDTSDDALVKISYLGKNFPVWFGDKVESDIPPSTLTYSTLVQGASDPEIISALGGAENAETHLAHMFHLMSLQPHGEAGVLLNDGCVNFFYIKDTTGTLRTIRLLWQDGGWGIHAIRPLDPLNLPIWKEGSRVFSRG
jgi:hypothetical protein